MTTNSLTGTQIGEHAVIVGGSIAGLLAARVLSERFKTVTILERDAEPSGPHARPGAPQAMHVHVLLEAGRTIIARYFPGFFEELEQSGSLALDTQLDVSWYHFGVWKKRSKSGITVYSQSRPLLEYHIRRRLKAVSNVRFLDECSAEGLLLDKARNRLTGVRYRQKDGMERSVEADLVVDAAGRASKFPAWFAALGCEAPAEEKVTVNLGYTTRLYRRPKNDRRDWACMLVYPKAPDNTKFGLIFPIEPDGGTERLMVSMIGCGGDFPPADEARFLEHAQKLVRPEVYDYIQKLEPITSFTHFRFIENRRRRYGKMNRLPGGFVAVGDALCAVNPIYGQGISKAALEVQAMERALNGGLDGVGRRYFRKVAWTGAIAWLVTTSEDFRYPHTGGKRPFFTPFMNAYTGKLLEASGSSPAVWAEFLRVLHFISPPQALFKPFMLLGAIKAALFPGNLAHAQPLPALRPGEGIMAAREKRE